VVDRLLIDIAPTGQASVSTWWNGEYPGAFSEPADLTWPLDAADLEDLRWYLEDYLRAPFGVYEVRGPEIEARLPSWGRAMFEALFGTGPARDAYIKMRARSRAGEIVLRSSAPSWLGLPWELLRDPNRPTALALDGIALGRSLPNTQLGEAFDVSGERLRVLMVISRPRGTEDVDYRMIARPLLQRLEAVHGRVDLEVLRPPTLDMLTRTLQAAREAGNPFQIVHFDGHGVLTGARAGARAPLSFAEPAGHGVLVFEKPQGGPDHVPAERVAQVLADAQVPVVVLNACQSGAVGKELEAAVATRLLAGGASAVVAMAYSVYAVAAAEFMAAFYERLFAGDAVGDAVRAGRAQMAQQPKRPSPKGELPLADWAIPVHYARREVRFPDLRTSSADAPPRPHGRDDPLAPMEEFVGRDSLFYTLEAAARTQRVVVLHGPAGTGKTELAKAFGRWWRDTGGVAMPEWVIWHSFEPGVASFGLDGVVSAIGLQVDGADFARKDDQARRDRIRDLLCEYRLLLIWDNFESVASMPDPASATPPLDSAAQDELREFLAHIATRGQSVVLITSRTPETWLGEVRRVEVGGLSRSEANEYADALLAPFPAAMSRRMDRAFGELLEWLDGHPLSMRLMLPHLDSTDAFDLLAGLRGTRTLPKEYGKTRTTSLEASISYSYSHLDNAVRSRLVVVSLFQEVASAVVLHTFSKHDEVPQRFADLDTEKWIAILDQATQVGLLTALGMGNYGIHPALPAFLARQWCTEDPDTYQAEHAAAERVLLSAHAALGTWFGTLSDTEKEAAAVHISRQRRTLGNLLAYALDAGLWDKVSDIAQPLQHYWTRSGMTEELRNWTDRVRLALEGPDGALPVLDQSALRLWRSFVCALPIDLVTSGQYEAAERVAKENVDTLLSQPESALQRDSLKAAFHTMGLVVRERGRLDEAEQWHRRAQTPDQGLTDLPDNANTYRRKGDDALSRDELDEAEQWYRKSLADAEKSGDQSAAARAYSGLGVVAQRSGRVDEAEQWCRKSLKIIEASDDRRARIDVYRNLGGIALRRGHLDEAEQWYLNGLTVSESIGDVLGTAASYGTLGILADIRGRTDDALEWVIRSFALVREFAHPGMSVQRKYLAQLTGQLGMGALEQCWLQVTKTELPAEVRTFVETFEEDRD
jgi:tetratricopeptide (TPR) repeat protein